MAGTPLDELDNFYTDLKQSITEVDARINNLKLTPGINAEGESKEILKLITQIQTQRKLYAELLRQYVKKTDDAGTKVMTPEDVIEYKKKATEIEQETKRLRAELKSAKTAQTDHEELFAGGTEEKEPETAQEHWKATEGIQNETLEKAQAALSMGHEANAAADDALRKQEENMEMEKEIVRKAVDLKETYGISFNIMFAIMKGLACDTCFQVLMGILALAIVAMLVVKYTQG